MENKVSIQTIQHSDQRVYIQNFRGEGRGAQFKIWELGGFLDS